MQDGAVPETAPNEAADDAEWQGLDALPLGSLDDELLARFHATLLKPAFPPSELKTFEELRDARLHPSTKGLVLTDGQRPVAGVVTEDYLGGRVLLITNLVVADHLRSSGLGARLLGRAVAATQAQLVLAEVEDPRYFPIGDGGDPVRRLRFYDHLGWRLLPLPYVPPALRPVSPRVADLLLIALQESATDVDSNVVTAFLDEYFSVYEGEAVVRS